jgi:hypothetical protein
VADDPQDLALPGAQPRRGLFQEVQQVLLRKLQQRAAPRFLGLGGRGVAGPGDGAPQVVVDAFLVLAPLPLAAFLAGEVWHATARHPEDGLGGQRMGGVQHAFHRRLAVPVLGVQDVAAGELQVVEDAAGIRPFQEQVVVPEEVVVAEGGVRNHQRLHHRRVLLHHVAEAGEELMTIS